MLQVKRAVLCFNSLNLSPKSLQSAAVPKLCPVHDILVNPRLSFTRPGLPVTVAKETFPLKLRPKNPNFSCESSFNGSQSAHCFISVVSEGRFIVFWRLCCFTGLFFPTRRNLSLSFFVLQNQNTFRKTVIDCVHGAKSQTGQESKCSLCFYSRFNHDKGSKDVCVCVCVCFLLFS